MKGDNRSRNFCPTRAWAGRKVKGCKGIAARRSDHVFFCAPRGTSRRAGKSYLESVLKEIHVGTNPDITEHTLCRLVPTIKTEGKDKSARMTV